MDELFESLPEVTSKPSQIMEAAMDEFGIPLIESQEVEQTKK